MDGVTDYVGVQSSEHGRKNAALAPLLYTDEDQSLVPVGMSSLLATSCCDEPNACALKRHRVEYEQGYTALETTSTYQDAMASAQSKMWSDAIRPNRRYL